MRPVNAVATWINARAMTVYLWHMLVLVLMAGTLLLSGAALPLPLSVAWWDTRPVWLLCAFGLVALVAAVTARWETAQGAKGMPVLSRGAASGSAVLAVCGVVVILATGFSLAGGVISLACLAAALLLARGRALSLRSPQPVGG
ncbi:hypothetical protein [Humibacter ginsenosidimutans]|uniref:Uncharacterized protein n=1 Tax=Humibacter ginsenosidimutans TaxID=2599293 RepID=A0A5B8M7Q3_9MICO|nr:hypothetical protein [Humibacter ginsenosidimutans]QDZ16426.1 hypothetical protein FPZ11_18235 [Humibacter ginsenosidimutans]